MMKARRNKPLDLLGRGVGGHVEIFRSHADQQIAHRAADDVGLEAGLGQRAHDLDGSLVDQRRIDAVLGLQHLDPLTSNHRWCRERFGDGFGGFCRTRFPGRLAEQLVEQFLDHSRGMLGIGLQGPDSHRMCRSAPGPSVQVSAGGHSNKRRIRQPRATATASSGPDGLVATGFGRLLEQRQVVDRIAIDADAPKIAPAQILPGQPLRDPGDLAFAVARRAGDAAGDRTAGIAIEPHGDERVDAEGARDRCGDEIVGRGDERHQVTTCLVLRGPAPVPLAASPAR